MVSECLEHSVMIYFTISFQFKSFVLECWTTGTHTAGQGGPKSYCVVFKNQHCAKSKTHIVHNVDFKIWASRTRFCTFALSIFVSNYQNLTFWAKVHRQTDGRTDRQTRFPHRYPWPCLYFANTIALRAIMFARFCHLVFPVNPLPSGIALCLPA